LQSFELVWVDNGSGRDVQQEILEIYPKISRRVLFDNNQGVVAAINTLFFRLCASPYVLLLEEDWEYQLVAPNGQVTEPRKKAIQYAIAVLEADAKVGSVFLRQHPDSPENGAYNFTGWFNANRKSEGSAEIRYKRRCPVNGQRRGHWGESRCCLG
jgi:hypothetical protein